MTAAAPAAPAPGPAARRPSRFHLGALERRRLRWGLFFISPWLIGFIVLTIYPIVYTFYLSFTRYSGFGTPTVIGGANYNRLAADPLFWKSAYNTLYYTLLAVPVGIVVAMVLALAMNQKVKEVAWYRAAFYLPSILPVFALTFIFILVLNPGHGLLNFALTTLGLPSPDWLGDPAYTKIGLVLLAQMGAGQFALVFLAALRGIPTELYESAALDGAGAIKKFRHITLPMMTPVILYDLIIGLSFGLQVFTQPYIMTGGGATGAGPDNSMLTYVFYLYKNAFQLSQMGYAAALSIVLFVVSLIVAMIVFRWAGRWVYYEGA
jgi:multiple sugar transport system permease protein